MWPRKRKKLQIRSWSVKKSLQNTIHIHKVEGLAYHPPWTTSEYISLGRSGRGFLLTWIICYDGASAPEMVMRALTLSTKQYATSPMAWSSSSLRTRRLRLARYQLLGLGPRKHAAPPSKRQQHQPLGHGVTGPGLGYTEWLGYFNVLLRSSI